MGIQTHAILLRKARKEGDSWVEERTAKKMSREAIFPEGEEHVRHYSS
jgi:hypothetical protein